MTQEWSVDMPGLPDEHDAGHESTSDGLASLTVHAAFMGKMAYTSRAWEEHTKYEATDWVSDTSGRCQVGKGVQGSRRAVVTAGESDKR